MRLWVDLNSLPENIGLPEALVGPDDPLELLEPPELVELPDVPEPPPEVDPPPEPELDEDDDDDDPLVVRGTAWPANAGTANPMATRNVSVRIDVVMAGSLCRDCSLTCWLPDCL
jgi:hypothetical protein